MKKIITLILLSGILIFISLVDSQAQPNNRTVLGFDAVPNSFVDVPTSPALSPQTFTIEFWVNISNTSGTILSNATAVGVPPSGYTIRLESNGSIQFVIANGNWETLNSTNQLVNNTWTHVAAVYTGTQMMLYLNGVLNGEKTLTTPMLASPQRLFFGDDATWTGRNITGKMSDVRLWNVARTQAQIQANMNNFLTGTQTGLVANWRMTEGQGMTVTDALNNHNGTRGTGTAWVTILASKKEGLDQRISIWPNPSQGLVQVKLQSGNIGHYKVYSSTGALVQSGDFSKNTALDLSNFTKGLYILKVTGAGEELQKRLILQ